MLHCFENQQLLLFAHMMSFYNLRNKSMSGSKILQSWGLIWYTFLIQLVLILSFDSTMKAWSTCWCWFNILQEIVLNLEEFQILLSQNHVLDVSIAKIICTLECKGCNHKFVQKTACKCDPALHPNFVHQNAYCHIELTVCIDEPQSTKRLVSFLWML